MLTKWFSWVLLYLPRVSLLMNLKFKQLKLGPNPPICNKCVVFLVLRDFIIALWKILALLPLLCVPWVRRMLLFDVKQNPMVTIFHVWSGSFGGSRRTRGSTKGKHGENKRESLNRQGINHTSARSPRTKSNTWSAINKGKDTKEPFFFVRRSWIREGIFP